MDLDKMKARGITNEGNLMRFAAIMKKAQNKEPLTIGFLGGSITMGALSSKPTTCYAYQVYEWWKTKFCYDDVTYINAGIGATTSQFAIARLDQDLLCYEPDVVFLEFSVNDEDTYKFQQTYEACVRKILSSKKQPALLMIHNVLYDTGINAQNNQNEIGLHYELPIVSLKDSIYQEIVDGKLKESDITPDHLHPNDVGHQLVAGVITHLLDQIYEKVNGYDSLIEYVLPKAYTKNSYENSFRYDQTNVKPWLDGFVKDEVEQKQITDVFRNGWKASKVGAKITFQVTGSMISVQYRQSIHKPAPIAKATVDYDEEHAIILDANFTENWGDKLELQDLLVEGDHGTHTITITILEAKEPLASEFYLASIITA